MAEYTLPIDVFDVTVGELIPAIPSDAQQDDVRGEVTPLKGRRVSLHEPVLMLIKG